MVYRWYIPTLSWSPQEKCGAHYRFAMLFAVTYTLLGCLTIVYSCWKQLCTYKTLPYFAPRRYMYCL